MAVPWLLLMFAVVQGFTEVLPVSSSAHLAITRQALGAREFSLAMAAGLHGGSLLAFVAWLRRDLRLLPLQALEAIRTFGPAVRSRGLRAVLQRGENNTAFFLAVSLVPLAVVGFALKSHAETAFSDIKWTSGLMVVNGLIIVATGVLFRGERRLSDLSFWDFLFIATLQGLAVLPGISRLGLTICLGLSRRLHWYEAVRLSLLYAIPAIAGGLFVQLPELLAAFVSVGRLWVWFVAALAVVFSCGLLGLRLLTSRFLERRALPLFGQYCILAGAFTFVYFAFWS